MADTKVSALTAAGALDGTEVVPAVQSTVTKKVTVKDIAKFGYQDILTDATTAKTLALSDLGAWIRFTSDSAITLTVPTNATVAFPIGTSINGVQAATGQISFAGTPTINKPTDYNAKTRAQGAAFCLIKVAIDTWDLFGDMELTPV